MAEYIGRLIARYGIPIHASVIYLRPNVGRNDRGKYEFAIGNSKFVLEYNVVRLAEIDGQKILNSKRIGQLPFSPLTKPPSNTDPDQWMRQCVQAVDQIRAIDDTSELDRLGLKVLTANSIDEMEIPNTKNKL